MARELREVMRSLSLKKFEEKYFVVVSIRRLSKYRLLVRHLNRLDGKGKSETMHGRNKKRRITNREGGYIKVCEKEFEYGE